jgi:hypothetical protein
LALTPSTDQAGVRVNLHEKKRRSAVRRGF